MEELLAKKKLEANVFSIYKNKGIETIFEGLPSVKTVRKVAKGGDFKEISMARISTMLDIVSILATIKQIANNKKERLKLADKIEEIAEELRNI